MNFSAHVADLRAALADHPSDDSRVALSCLPQDGLAQVLSYLDCAPVLLTLSAVSPQARLDAETLHNENVDDSPSPACCRCQIVEKSKLMFKISSQFRQSEVPHLGTKLWWAERCELPVALQDEHAYNFLVAKLNNTLRTRVAHVEVKLNMAEKCFRSSDAAKLLCDGNCYAVLCSLALVPNLSTLNLEGGSRIPSVQLPLWLPSRLSITTLKVRKVQLQNDAAFFVGWVSLRSVSLQDCGIQSVDAFASMQSLVELDVSHNRNLATLSPLSNAPSLQKLRACGCTLRSVDGLGTCARLREIDVSENKSLVNLDGLAGATELRTLKAVSCGLRSLDPLRTCRCLEEIDVSGNENLESLSGLSDATELQTLRAVGCGLWSLDALRTCRRLKEIDVSRNNLESLDGLSGAAKLVNVNAASCNLFNIDALKALPLLRVVDVSHNRALQSLLPLAGAPHLSNLSATHCGIRSVEGLGRCPKLAVIDLMCNENLTDISDLAAAPLLRYVNATRTRVYTRAAGFPSGKVFVKPFDKKEGTPNHLICYGGRMPVRGMQFGDRWELALSSDADSSERHGD